MTEERLKEIEGMLRAMPSDYERRQWLEEHEIRVCDRCGKAYTEGYYFDGEYFCSDECVDDVYGAEQSLIWMYDVPYEDEQWLLHGNGRPYDIADLVKYLEEHYEESGNCYWTQWGDIEEQEIADMVNEKGLLRRR